MTIAKFICRFMFLRKCDARRINNEHKDISDPPALFLSMMKSDNGFTFFINMIAITARI